MRLSKHQWHAELDRLTLLERHTSFSRVTRRRWYASPRWLSIQQWHTCMIGYLTTMIHLSLRGYLFCSGTFRTWHLYCFFLFYYIGALDDNSRWIFGKFFGLISVHKFVKSEPSRRNNSAQIIVRQPRQVPYSPNEGIDEGILIRVSFRWRGGTSGR